MAVKRRSVNLLPGIFQTDTNRKFLGVTLDQLISEPEFKRLDGYAGRKFNPAFKPSKSYIVEANDDRQNYQLEPTYVTRSTQGVPETSAGYTDLISKIEYYGGLTTNHDRLFNQEFYNYQPPIDLDKFVNYSQYYWMPVGPEPVLLTSKNLSTSSTIYINEINDVLTTSLTGNTPNPRIYLLRGNSYTFTTTTTSGNIFIQTEPGTQGTRVYSPGETSREIAGLSGNGTDTITFNIPKESAQDYYLRFDEIDSVDYAIDEAFNFLDNAVWQFGQGMTLTLSGDQFYPDGSRFIFLHTNENSIYWQDRDGNVLSDSQRRSIWQGRVVKYSGEAVRVQLDYVRTVGEKCRVTVGRGEHRGRDYFINDSGFWQEYPNITSESSLLFFQHTESQAFGTIEILDELQFQINVNNIIGAKTYTSPTGIKLSNGMKIRFDDTIVPIQYRNKTYIVEGVGRSIRLVDFTLLQTPEVIASQNSVSFDSREFDIGGYDESFTGSYIPDYIVANRAGVDLNGWARINRWFHIDVIRESYRINGLTFDQNEYVRAQRPIIEFERDLQLFNYGRQFLAFADKFFTQDDYLKINFNKVIINNAFSLINQKKFSQLALEGLTLLVGQTCLFANDIDPVVRKRLYKVAYLDQTYATTYEGTLTGTVRFLADTNRVTGIGTSFSSTLYVGSNLYTDSGLFLGRVLRILGDNDLELENNATINTAETSAKFTQARVELIPVTQAYNYDIITVLTGKKQGESYYFYDDTWVNSQRKRQVNQDPLYDIITPLDVSFSKAFPESSFQGTAIFSYKRGNGPSDSVLEFPLTYSTSAEFIGDITFVNNFDTDIFYTRDGPINVDRTAMPINSGYLRRITNRAQCELVNVYATVQQQSRQFQHASGVYEEITNYFEIGAAPDDEAINSIENNIRVYINNQLIKLATPDDPEYTYEIVGARHAIKINIRLLSAGDVIDIFYFSSQRGNDNYYQIPINLELNPFNAPVTTISTGQMRNHVKRMGDNFKNLTGSAVGNTSLRDLDITGTYGSLVQHSASLVPAMAMLLDEQVNFVNALDYARREYSRFKNKFIDSTIAYANIRPEQVPDTVDEIIEKINTIKTVDFAWYYSDMFPSGKKFTLTRYTVTNDRQRTYNISRSYRSSGPGNYAILVYLNNRLLSVDRDYFYDVAASFTISDSVFLKEDDLVLIKEYKDTDACFVPETPTKLGLHPRFVPGRYLEKFEGQDQYVIQGHDGSLFPAFNDIRDDLIIELENRIYNNIKVSYTENIFNYRKIVPGKYRTTQYTRTEFASVLNVEFLKWAGFNQLNFTENRYESNNEWSWNYNQSRDLDSQRVPGYWRGIYRYYYDTDRPDTHPWEMFGITVKPSWWDQYYSWTDTVKRAALITAIESGRINSPGAANTLINTVYSRPNFSRAVPVDHNGELLPPQRVMISDFDSTRLSRNFAAGDGGPIESAWYRTSDYAFALQKTYALLKPAQYFGMLYDSFVYERKNFSQIKQFSERGSNVRKGFHQFKINGENVNGNITRTAGYLNWVHGYITGLGIDASQTIRQRIQSSQINLAYKVGGFTDKKYITVMADQFAFTSTSDSVIIPDESYFIHLNKSVPTETVVYSAVIVEKTANGFAVSGYDQRFPYFVIIPSDPTGQTIGVDVLGTQVRLFENFKAEKIRVPYGYEFTTPQQVADFLISYQRYLVAQGFLFDTYDNDLGVVRNWDLSVREFLTWFSQGWPEGNFISLSPVVDSISVYNDIAMVDTVDNHSNGSELLNSSFVTIRNSEFTINRDNKRTTINTISGQTIAFARFNMVQFEHVLIFDNHTIFGDTIYNPALGDRQFRLKLVGSKTDNWDGDLTPPGFVYTLGEIEEWQPNYDYKKGTIVKYKGRNYSALQDVLATETFNFNYYTLLDSSFRAGLAPNFSHNAGKLSGIYDIDNQPLDESVALFSNGLIGYRSRAYLENLGINNTSQVKFYQGYIREKGTRNAINALARGDFDEQKGDIELFEEWGARMGEYGAIDSNPEYSFLLTKNPLTRNPLNFQFLLNENNTDSEYFLPIRFNNLLTSPLDYSEKIFLNRNETQVIQRNKIWNIELFGDSIMCGKRIDTQTYGVEVIRRRGYKLLTRVESRYSAIVTGRDNLAIDTLFPGQEFQVFFSSDLPYETMYITIEPPTANDVPLSSTLGTNFNEARDVFPQHNFVVDVDTRESQENLYVTYEAVVLNDLLGSTTSDGEVYAVSDLDPGQEFYIKINSAEQTEEMYWSIEEVLSEDNPNTKTQSYVRSFSERVCLNDKVLGRVENPPDSLLYEKLIQDISVNVLTRSVEGSRTFDLLNGTDGVNGIWPDNIDADIIVLNHGIEDALTGVPVQEYKNNLRQIRNKLTKNIIVIWQTPNRLDTTNPNTVVLAPATNNTSIYAQAMREIAYEFGDYIADVNSVSDWDQYISVDGIHPTQEGYEFIVNEILAPTINRAIFDKINSDRRFYEDDLQSGGYARIGDVDRYLFNIADASLVNIDILNEIQDGYKIWVAKDYNKDWQVIRAQTLSVLIIAARADLDNKVLFTCDTPHGLDTLDIVVVRGVSADIDGFYQVFSADLNEFSVVKSNIGDSTFEASDLVGELFKFKRLRYKTYRDMLEAEQQDGWVARNYFSYDSTTKSDLLYIDDIDGLGSWAVFDVTLTGYQYQTNEFASVNFSNVYSIIGVDCANINYIVSNISSGGEINFCVFSQDAREELFYTIEDPVAADFDRDLILAGRVSEPVITTTLVAQPQYIYNEIRRQQPVVDIESINNIYLYNKFEQNIIEKLDFYDPIKGRILSSARQDIDYISSNDPAIYRSIDPNSDVGLIDDVYWAQNHVGLYWWNTDVCRFIDYEQGSLDYRMENWGKIFPGSAIHVYEWIASPVLPSLHVSSGQSGIPLYANDEFYSEAVFVDPETNVFVNRYFYWVRTSSEKRNKNKIHTTLDLETVISDPVRQNISYLTAYRDDAIGLHNIGQFMTEGRTVLYLSTRKVINENIVHSDFKLLQEGNKLSVIPALVENKIIDSLVGADLDGNNVPDPKLGAVSKLGLNIRPRQTVVTDVVKARKNVIAYINDILTRYPIAEKIYDKDLIISDNFFASEPEPTQFDIRVDKYQDLSSPVQTDPTITILVANDETLDGYWALYQRTLVGTSYNYKLVRRQKYDVTKHWYYHDWYAEGYSKDTVPDYIVDRFLDVYLLDLQDGDIVFVKNLSSREIKYGNIKTGDIQVEDKFELYKFNQNSDGRFYPELIGLQNGTVQMRDIITAEVGFDTNEFDIDTYDVNTFIEMRYIMAGVKQDLFTGILSTEYNTLMYKIINYILSEQPYIDWFFKTSFVTVKQTIHGLEQSPSYIKDRQKNIMSYIEEVKPYKTKIREYIQNHSRVETYGMNITDFDLPPFYDEIAQRFRSPNGEAEGDLLKLQEPIYTPWVNNHKYSIQSLLIGSPGYGYQINDNGTELLPAIEVFRTDTNIGKDANIRVGLDTVNYGINKYYIDDGGSNFTLTPEVRVIGVGGTRQSDELIHNFTVTSIGYSAFIGRIQNKRSFGLYKEDKAVNLLKNYQHSLVNAAEWTVGSGTSNDFIQNGDTEENQRVYGIDPWGEVSVVWETRPTGGVDADGGWNHANFAIDNTKLYRSVVWVKRTSFTSAGTVYHGLHTNGTGDVIRIIDGISETNPYWNYRGAAQYEKDVWYLHVGHIHPSTFPGLNNHPDSGIYTRLGVKVMANSGNLGGDGRFPANATTAMQRVYHYYSGDPTTRIQFAFPRFEIVDGNEPSIQELLDFGPYQNPIYTEKSRGYHMHRIRRKDARITFTRTYDIYAQDTTGYLGYSSADLARDLNETTSDYVVVVHTYDEPYYNRLTNDLAKAMHRCGASIEVFGKPDVPETTFKYRSSYILVGIPGCGVGRGIEHYAGSNSNAQDAWCQITFKIQKGHLAPVAADPRFYVFATPFQFPANPLMGQSYTFGERTYTWSGYSWINNKVIASTVTDVEANYAKLTPLLENKTVRKVKTVLRFDRTQYTSKVRQWEPFIEYPVGTYLSYNGDCYYLTQVLEADDVFPIVDPNFMVRVGIDKLPSSREFRDGVFDNANDRIMGFYVQTQDNIVPKDLKRLVPGIDELFATYTGNLRVSQDTILVGDTFGSNAGISSGNISLLGGKFVDRLFSHSPPELLPGQIFESINIRVLELTQPPEPVLLLPPEPASPLTLVVTQSRTKVKVPMGFGNAWSRDTFTVQLFGGQDGVVYPVTITVYDKPAAGEAFVTPTSLTMLRDEQREIRFSANTFAFNPHGVWYDLSQYENNFPLINSPLFDAGYEGHFKFDGVDDASTGSVSQFNLQATAYNTVQLYMRWDGSDLNGFPMEFGSGYRLWLNNGNLGFNNGAGDLYGINFAAYKKKWVFVTAVFYNGNYTGQNKIYINDKLQTLTQISGASTSNTVHPTLTVGNFGPDPLGTSYAYQMKYDIAVVLAYNRELQLTEIRQNYLHLLPRYLEEECGLNGNDGLRNWNADEVRLLTPDSPNLRIHQNQFIQYAVNGIGRGAIGQGNTQPGFKFDPNGTGTFGAGDFIAPGNPFEAWGFEISKQNGDIAVIGGSNSTNDPRDSSGIYSAPAIQVSLGVNDTLIYKGNDTWGYGIVQYKTNSGEPFIRMRMTYTNTTGQPVSVRAYRAADPDNGSGSASTNIRGYNSIPKTDIVSSVASDGSPLSLYVPGNGFEHNTGVVAGWPFKAFDITYLLTGPEDPPAQADYAICGAWNIGVVQPNQTVAVSAFWVCAPNLSVIESIASGCQDPTTTTTSTTSTTTEAPIPWTLSVNGGATKAGGTSFNFAWTAPASAIGQTVTGFVTNPNTLTPFSGSAISSLSLSISINATSGSFGIATTAITSGPAQTFDVILSSTGVISTGLLARSQTCTIAGPWSVGYASRTFILKQGSLNYFKFDRVKIIQGDGSPDAQDWAIFNFDTDNNGDYDGTAGSKSFFGGESVSSGGTGGVATHGAVWGFNSANNLGWQLLYTLPLGTGSGSAYNHSQGKWLESGGGTATGSSFGKRSEYDSMPVEKIAFAAYTSAPMSFNNGSSDTNPYTNLSKITVNGAQEVAVIDLQITMPLLDYMMSFGVGPNDSNTG